MHQNYTETTPAAVLIALNKGKEVFIHNTKQSNNIPYFLCTTQTLTKTEKY